MMVLETWSVSTENCYPSQQYYILLHAPYKTFTEPIIWKKSELSLVFNKNYISSQEFFALYNFMKVEAGKYVLATLLRCHTAWTTGSTWTSSYSRMCPFFLWLIVFDNENEIKLYVSLTNLKVKSFLDSSLPFTAIKNERKSGKWAINKISVDHIYF